MNSRKVRPSSGRAHLGAAGQSSASGLQGWSRRALPRSEHVQHYIHPPTRPEREFLLVTSTNPPHELRADSNDKCLGQGKSCPGRQWTPQSCIYRFETRLSRGRWGSDRLLPFRCPISGTPFSLPRRRVPRPEHWTGGKVTRRPSNDAPLPRCLPRRSRVPGNSGDGRHGRESVAPNYPGRGGRRRGARAEHRETIETPPTER